MRDRGRQDWALQAFGEHAAPLRDQIPKALAQAHARARAGHDATASKNLRIYGLGLWEFHHEELVAAAATLDGTTVAKLGGYELSIVAHKALFPLHYTDRAGVPVERARLRLPVSRQRERLFGAHAPDIPQLDMFLDQSWADLDPSEQYETFPQLGDETELIVIAYACNLNAGVLHVEWGRAEHIGGGELHWGDHSPLPLTSTPVTAAGLLRPTGPGTNGHRFDTGEEPGLSLGMRYPGDQELGLTPQTERHPDQPLTQDDDQH